MVALQHICICSATLKGVTGVGEIIEQAGIGGSRWRVGFNHFGQFSYDQRRTTR